MNRNNHRDWGDWDWGYQPPIAVIADPIQALIESQQLPEFDEPEPLIINGYDPERFVNQEAIESFKCVICFCVPLNPSTHLQKPMLTTCPHTFCSTCLSRLATEVNFTCPFRCVQQRDFGPIVAIPEARKSVYLDLELMCQFIDCFSIISLRHISEHQLCCQHKTKGEKDVDDYQSYFEHLKDLQQENRRKETKDSFSQTAETDSSHRIEELESRIKELERLLTVERATNSDLQSRLNQENRDNNGIQAISNHLRCSMEHRNLEATINFGERQIVINNLDLEMTGQDLINKVREEIGEDPGQLLFIRHIPIQPELRLRQHSLGLRPFYAVGLGSRRVANGRSLKIRIMGLGPQL